MGLALFLMSFNVGLFPSPRFAALRESYIHHKSWVRYRYTSLSHSLCPQPPSHPQAERVLPDVKPPPLHSDVLRTFSSLRHWPRTISHQVKEKARLKLILIMLLHPHYSCLEFLSNISALGLEKMGMAFFL